MKKEIELKPCKCGKDKIFEESDIRGMLFGHIIGCCNLDCDIGAVVGVGLTPETARRKAIKEWNKIVSR